MTRWLSKTTGASWYAAVSALERHGWDPEAAAASFASRPHRIGIHPVIIACAAVLLATFAAQSYLRSQREQSSAGDGPTQVQEEAARQTTDTAPYGQVCAECDGSGTEDCPYCTEGVLPGLYGEEAGPCPHCNGLGWRLCDACDGTGRQPSGSR